MQNPLQQQLQNQFYLEQLIQQQLQNLGSIQNGPFVYENSDYDQYGNPFLERQLVQSNFYFTPIETVDKKLPTGNLLLGLNEQNNQIMNNQVKQQMDSPLVQSLQDSVLTKQIKKVKDTLEKFEHRQIPGLQHFDLIKNEVKQNENQKVEDKETVSKKNLEKNLLESTNHEMMQQVKKGKKYLR